MENKFKVGDVVCSPKGSVKITNISPDGNITVEHVWYKEVFTFQENELQSNEEFLKQNGIVDPNYILCPYFPSSSQMTTLQNRMGYLEVPKGSVLGDELITYKFSDECDSKGHELLFGVDFDDDSSNEPSTPCPTSGKPIDYRMKREIQENDNIPMSGQNPTGVEPIFGVKYSDEDCKDVKINHSILQHRNVPVMDRCIGSMINTPDGIGIVLDKGLGGCLVRVRDVEKSYTYSELEELNKNRVRWVSGIDPVNITPMPNETDEPTTQLFYFDNVKTPQKMDTPNPALLEYSYFDDVNEVKQHFDTVEIKTFKMDENKNIIPSKLEDIYPLTIVSRRFGGFAIVNCESDCSAVWGLGGVEDVHYNTEGYMSENWYGIKYGIGDTIDEAFKDYLTRNHPQ